MQERCTNVQIVCRGEGMSVVHRFTNVQTVHGWRRGAPFFLNVQGGGRCLRGPLEWALRESSFIVSTQIRPSYEFMLLKKWNQVLARNLPKELKTSIYIINITSFIHVYDMILTIFTIKMHLRAALSPLR